MNLDELNIIINRGEDIWTEFKEARDRASGSVYESLVAFLNREGGVILLGVEDNGKISGIDPSAVDQVRKDIITTMNNREVVNPPVNFPVYKLEQDGKIILCLKIPVSSQVHNCKGVIYDRENDSDIAVEDDARISSLYFRKRNTFTEGEILKHLRMEDFDNRLFEKTRLIVGALDRSHPWIESDNLTILRDSQLYRRDPRTGEEGLTLASVLIFGKDEVIQSVLPGYKVDVLVRLNDPDRFDDRMAPLRINLIDTYQKIMEFIKSKPYLPERFYLEGDQRKDLRELIFRELVGNMIVHREYTSAHATELVIYRDRVEITNPNISLFKGILSLDTFNPYPKNPTIRKFFSEFGWTDELGSGVKNVKKYLSVYADGAKPTFIEDDLFRAIIPLSRPAFGTKAKTILSVCGLDIATLSNQLVEDLMQLSLFPSLAELADLDTFIFQIGGRWAERGGKLIYSRVNKINKINFIDFEKGSSWTEKGGKLLPKRLIIVIEILIICLRPAKTEEIKQTLSFGSREKLRELYIIPLRKDGLIQQVIIDKPNSPDQRYLITEKGRLFLGGFEV